MWTNGNRNGIIKAIFGFLYSIVVVIVVVRFTRIYKINGAKYHNGLKKFKLIKYNTNIAGVKNIGLIFFGSSLKCSILLLPYLKNWTF